MNAASGIVTSGTGPPNAVVQVQPGMQVQPVVLVDANGQYVTTSGATATAGYLADLTGSVNVSQAAAPDDRPGTHRDQRHHGHMAVRFH